MQSVNELESGNSGTELEPVWEAQAVERGAFVVHRATLAAGQAKRYWSGVLDDRYAAAEESLPLACPVLELDTGHALIAGGADAWIDLGERGQAAWMAVRVRMVAALEACVQEAARLGVGEDASVLLVQAAIGEIANGLRGQP